MPWEETDEFIRSGHRSSDDFQEDSFRTITIDADKGIKAILGKPMSKPVGKDTTEVQSYILRRIRIRLLRRLRLGSRSIKARS